MPAGRALASALTHLHLGINRALLTLQSVWGVSPRTAMPTPLAHPCPAASACCVLPLRCVCCLLHGGSAPPPAACLCPSASTTHHLHHTFLSALSTTIILSADYLPSLCPALSHSSPPLGLEVTCFVSVVS